MNLDIVIMAAGKGTRMDSPLPKVLHTLKGKPMIQHVMQTADQLADGIDAKITTIVGYRGELVVDFCDEIKINTRRSYVAQEPQLGTGHAVMQAVPELSDSGITVILNGDTPLIRVETLERLARACGGTDMALLTVVMDDPFGYGRIVQVNGEITGIVEQKDATPDQLTIREVYTGAMAVPTDRLKVWLSKLDNKNAQNEYYLTDIVKMAGVEGIPIVTVRPKETFEVMGVNTPEQLAALEKIRDYEAVTFQPNVWKAVVNHQLQRPDFNSKGAALAFGEAVAAGKRKPEPVKV